MHTKPRILVIDDDETIRDILAITLEQEGFFVDTAINGKEAIEKSYASFFNIAIIDWRLPDIEGTKLLGKLKETKPRMVKIILTGFPSLENAIEAINERADAFLLKPIKTEFLVEKIYQLYKEQEHCRELIEYAKKAMEIAGKTYNEEESAI